MALDLNNSRGEVVIDPYKHKERFDNWNKQFEGLSKKNQEIILQYIIDMKKGVNINPKARKGKRSYHRLNTQRHRLKRVAEMLQEYFNIDYIAPTNEKDLKNLQKATTELFDRMEEGEIKKKNGKRFVSAGDYVKGWKSFWNWFIVYTQREKNKLLPNITEFLSLKEDRKPCFVFFGEKGKFDESEGFKKLLNAAKPKYKIVMAFAFDSGARVTELLNTKRKDITPIKNSDHYLLEIRDEVSKTFGRKIKLMLCHELLKEYLDSNKFEPNDFIFKINPRVINQYLKRLGEKVLKKKGLTMYDFRHNSACYWVSRYSKESSLMYRFGWKDSKMIHYYTEFKGHRDTIQAEDLLIDITKTELEKELKEEKNQRAIMQERLDLMEKQMAALLKNTQSAENIKEAIQIIRRRK